MKPTGITINYHFKKPVQEEWRDKEKRFVDIYLKSAIRQLRDEKGIQGAELYNLKKP